MTVQAPVVMDNTIDLMTVDPTGVIAKIRNTLDLVGSALDGYRVFLFGSRVTGKAKERSDFDIGVIGQEKIPLSLFYKIDDLFDEIDTLYSIDFVDMSDVSDSFKREALKKIEVLYG